MKKKQNSSLILIMLFGLVGILLSIGAIGEAIASFFKRKEENEGELESSSELAIALGK